MTNSLPQPDQPVRKTASRRISITVSNEELEQWIQADKRANLSAFIREAVNEYVKIQEPARRRTVFDLFVEQRQGLDQIYQALGRMESDLFEITAAIAQKDIIPEPEKRIIESRVADYIESEEFRRNLLRGKKTP